MENRFLISSIDNVSSYVVGVFMSLVKRINNLRNLISSIKIAYQNINPNLSDFMIDMSSKRRNIPANIRRNINNRLFDLGDYFDKLPVDDIFNILKEYDVYPIQEDGTHWSGLLLGSEACGSDAARKQFASIDLVFKSDKYGGIYILANNYLVLRWCTMPSGRYELLVRVS